MFDHSRFYHCYQRAPIAAVLINHFTLLIICHEFNEPAFSSSVSKNSVVSLDIFIHMIDLTLNLIQGVANEMLVSAHGPSLGLGTKKFGAKGLGPGLDNDWVLV